MEQYLPIIRTSKLFSGIEMSNLSAMLGCLGARVLSFSKGNTILQEGQPAKDVGLLLSGSAQVLRVDYYGNRSIVANVSPAQLFGEAFACAEVEHLPVSVVATEPCQVMMIDCHRITITCDSACSFHNQMIFNLLKMVAQKNILFHQKIEITSQRSTREKLMAYLLMQAKEQGSSQFTIPFDRQALADYLEVERSGLSAEISKLRKEGVLDTKRNWFELL